MATAIRAIGHEDRLSLVDHLDELRTRLIVSAIALAIAFGFCLWQNHALLHLINTPLSKQTQKQVAKGNGPLGQTALAQQGVFELAHSTEAIVRRAERPGSGSRRRPRAAARAARSPACKRPSRRSRKQAGRQQARDARASASRSRPRSP